MYNINIKKTKKLLAILSLLVNVKSIKADTIKSKIYNETTIPNNQNQYNHLIQKVNIKQIETLKTQKVHIIQIEEEPKIPFSHLDLTFIHNRRKISLSLEIPNLDYEIKVQINKNDIQKIIQSENELKIKFKHFNEKYILSINILKNQLKLLKNDILIQNFNKNFKIENISYKKFFTDARKNIIIGAIISGTFLISGHIINNYFGKVLWN